MLSLFQLLIDRLKVVVLAEVGLNLEAEFLSQGATRKAELLRLANRYEEEGLTDVAEELRASAQTLQADQPLARSLPIATNLLQLPGWNNEAAIENSVESSSPEKVLPDPSQVRAETSEPPSTKWISESKEDSDRQKDLKSMAKRDNSTKSRKSARKTRSKRNEPNS